jgi:glucose/arabinose dehydrogenase
MSKPLLHRFVGVCLCIFLYINQAFSQLPNGFIDAKIQGGYTSPMGVAFTKDGQKMFVWEKRGTLHVSNWNGTTYVKQANPVLNISDEVGDWRDFGFQCVALDPNFDSNGLIYTYYQVDRHHLINFGTANYNLATNEYFNASISRLTRYKVNNNGGTLTADPASRKILVGETRGTGIPLVHESHAGGQIVFGADGTLMVSTGDNASYASVDKGSASETYFQQAINDGIMRSTENVGAFRSQQINSHCGKLLRLDPNTGDAIPSNPYYDATNPRSAKSRTWALGLRNPYRISFKTGTGSTNASDGNPGTVIIADVQNGTWEDMHILEKGGLNCGWPLYEGIEAQGSYYNINVSNPEEPNNPLFKTLCPQPTSSAINATPSQRRFVHFPPALDWNHTSVNARSPEYANGALVAKTIGAAGSHVSGTPFKGNCATSGTYYSGTAFPANYRNVYFFADYGQNWIKAAVLHDNTDHQIHQVLDFAPTGYGKGVVDIEYCPLDQSIFYVNINSGDIQKVSFGSGNRPPVVAIGSDKTSGTSPLTVNLNSNGTSDPDGDALSYSWDFGDGTAKSTVANPQHTFTSTGSKGFTVVLTVTDSRGLSESKSLVVSVNNTAPTAKITNPTNTTQYTLASATNYTLQSNVTDNDVTGMQYAWQVTLRHNTHEHREPVINQQSPTVTISPVGCDGETYYYLIELQVTDNGGLTARDSVKIYPDCNSQNISISNLQATAQNNAVALSWTNPNIAFDEVMVVAKPNSGFTLNPNGTSYTANADYNGNGTAFEGGKVVYRGTGTSTTVTGLIANTKYFFRVFTRKGTNWNGGIETTATPTGTPPPPSSCNGDGKLYVETWNNLNGDCNAILPLSTTPTSAGVRTLTGFELPSNVGEYYGARVRGYICAPVSGNYTFYITSDNGGTLHLSTNSDPATKRQIAQVPTCNWTLPREWTKYPEQKSVVIALTAGQKYYIEAQFKEITGGDNLAIGWQTPSNSAISVIPASSLTAFSPTAPPPPTQQLGCLKGSYFNNISLTGTPIVRAESSVNYDWATGAPITGINVDNFSARWEGSVIPAATGAYTFVVTADDGVRLWVNNTLIIDKWIDQAPTQWSASINLTQGQNVPIKLEYYERGGGAVMRLNWIRPNQASVVTAFNACPIVNGFDANKCYRLTARASNKVLEVPNNSTVNGTQLQQRTYNGSRTQLWRLKNLGDGSYRMVNTNSGRSVDVSGGSIADNAQIIQWDWLQQNNQRWIFARNTEGYYEITAKHSNKAMDVTSSGTADGVPIIQYTVNKTFAQQWKVDEVGCPAGAIALQSDNLLAVEGYKEGKKAVITWISNANTDKDYFMVQKLDANQNVFEKVAIVNAKYSNAGEQQSYSIEDLNVTDDINVYRVVLFRESSTIPQYSELISLDFSHLLDFMVFPNPSSDYVDIDLEAVRYREVELIIVNNIGVVMKKQMIEKAPTAPVRMDLNGLESGQYLIHIKAEGKREVVKKLTIMK